MVKLGGWELGYSSDLDLIFLHDCPMDAMTDGEREIDGRQFYLRLARIMHLFSTNLFRHFGGGCTVASVRGGGNAGDIRSVCRLSEKRGWTWEHQALVRARSTAIRSSPRTLTQYAGRL
ncbi:hypothetical protein [Escherichia coli]|uniref:hypothetical protein n=1 Tax=Escherichia coli TaxID=562 RepID=UPI003DA01190